MTTLIIFGAICLFGVAMAWSPWVWVGGTGPE
jgi:hypothetical protein